MKVLERKEWAREVTCTGRGNGGNGCGSRLAVERADLMYYAGVPGDTWGSRDPAVTFKCVVCGALNDLDQAHWPQRAAELQPFKRDT